uniref:GIY endonuclease n=2 Tax=Colletotrichum lindemuthianum TaxID=290576 RepID=W6D9H8_COLLN|nr:GIY endonuclease [Colletotrichum lindemuthianum]AHI96209.1 GIY endonuclease [Colletotrichum lindemuthianum]
MVDKWRLFNHNFHTTSSPQTNNILITDDQNNNQNNNHEKIPKYTKVYVENPYANRKIILKVAKNQKGVYVWQDDKHAYVGHSINLYNRISSYFMPSILNTKARRVLRYFNKHGFNNVNLTIYIVDEQCTLDEVVRLEQHFIDTLKPSLNVDLVAPKGSSGYHEPMSQKLRNKLLGFAAKQRGTPVYIYSSEDFTLLYIFESKQYMYDTIKIHHKTLSNCLDTGDLFLDSFFFSIEIIEESDKTNLLSLEEITELVSNKRNFYNVKHPASKTILAKFYSPCPPKGECGARDSSKDIEFPSLNSLANHLKGDRQIIREYLKGEKQGYYRGKWEFTYKD